MSFTFTFTGTTSVLRAEFNPPILLDKTTEYVMGLTSFESFNTIPNVTSENNQFQMGNIPRIYIPEGSYEISDISKYISSQLNHKNREDIHIKANNNTLKTVIKGTYDIDFTINNSIGPLLGFTSRHLSANIHHESDYPANIIKINSLLIDCNITTGNYKNGMPAHVIHQFFPNVPPGYKIIECPLHITYLPISTKTISEITLQILDQDGKLVNFRGETVTIGLHLKSTRNGVSV